MNWKLVRGIGRLTLLTRASYFTLILVPILAAIWPAIRRFLNGYNSTVEQTVLLLENTTYTLEKGDARIETILNDHTSANDSIAIVSQEIIASLQSRIPALIEESSRMSIENTNLPGIWVWAFLAALGGFIAHTIYKVSAPEIVKRYNLREFSENQLDLYTNNPTVSHLEHAIDSRHKFKKVSTILNAEKMLSERYERQIVVNEDIDAEERKKAECELIEAYAVLQYIDWSRSRPGMSLITLVLYSFSIAVLLFITFNQCVRVLQAVGWIGN